MSDDIMGTAPPAEAMTAEGLELKRTLTDIIVWAEKNRPRSLQVKLGPSDLGSVCDRRLGYKIAGVPEVDGFMDPWTTFVGSAIHTRLQESIDTYERIVTRGMLRTEPRYLTEQDAPLDDFIDSHPDLLDVEKRMVIDHKSTTSDAIKKLHAGADINPGYIIQVQLYALAFERMGFKVDWVALAFYPRAGRLRDMFCWVAPYDRDVALVAYDRPYQIVDVLTELDVMNNPSRWADVPATASDMCGLCPWYDSHRQGMALADATGCPGA
jgi:hypothetical protein